MENKDMNQKPRATTGIDADGNMQVRSSGRAPVPPTRKPEGGGVSHPARRPVRRGPADAAGGRKRPAPSPVQKDEGVEYSFANSALFNNGAKPEKTAATAASEARRAREQGAPAPSTDTRVMQTPPKRRPRPENGRGTAPGTSSKAGVATRGKAAPHSTGTAPGGTGMGARGVRRPVNGNGAVTGAGAGSTKGPVKKQNPQGGAKTPSFKGMSRPKTVVGQETKITPAVKVRKQKKKPVVAELATEGVSKFSGAIAAMNSVTRALIYIAGVMLVSIVLSAVIITNCNDIFAFVKSDEQYTITIETGTDLNKLADQLKELGVIEHKNTFRLYIKYRDKESDAYTPGTYTVSPSMNYDQIISAITPKNERISVSITIPEGYTTDEIIELFVSRGMGTREGFEKVIASGDFSDYWFLSDLPVNPDRYYRLEGYLFPDTYYFYTDMSEDTIIRKFLDNFEKKFDEEYKVAAQGKGYTVDQIVTLASIIQAEGKERIVTVTNEETDESSSYVDYGLISSVFKNRLSLRNPMKLQSDATTLFALTMEKTGEDKVTGSNKNFENPYNTYNIDGLPPGAICNPGLNAIAFALWPDSSPYYYFVSDDEGNTYFAEDIDGHNANLSALG